MPGSMRSLPVTSMQREYSDAALLQLREGPAAVGGVRGSTVRLTGKHQDGVLLCNQVHPSAFLKQEVETFTVKRPGFSLQKNK